MKRSIDQLNYRLFSALPLLKALFVFTMIFIVTASAAPSVVRWFSGQVVAQKAGFYLSSLWLIVGIAIAFRFLAWMTFETSGMWSSQKLHGQMISGLARTRTTYFDDHSSGSILNRLVVDFGEVKETAIIFVGDLLNVSVEIIAVGVIAALTYPAAVLLLLPVLIGFFYIQNFRSLMIGHARNFSAQARGELLARQTDLIEGRDIFALYGKLGRLRERFQSAFSGYAKSALLMALIESWGSFWIRFWAETFSFVVLLLLCVKVSHQAIELPLAGVIISSLFGMTSSIGWLDYATGLVSRSAPHIERVFELVDLPSEETTEGQPQITNSNLGEQGIRFLDYSMSYQAHMPQQFQNLNLFLPRGKRVALTGRTGAGKSSLIQALFRMVHVHAGDILLDGQSIFLKSAAEHRQQFSVIPQTPYLFEGSIRTNLDPFSQIPEARLKLALEKVGLKFSLDTEIKEEGRNLSQGERQLICLARAIALDKSIIIMDEATSALDPETDARIIRVLKQEFAGKTLITIAHRLETVADYDLKIEFSDSSPKIVAT